jgi:hypothetical protein
MSMFYYINITLPNANQSVVNIFGVPKYTVNISPTLRFCSSSSKYSEKNFVQGVEIVLR